MSDNGAALQAVLKKELEAICGANGGVLLPSHVVEAASAKSHPLHKYFTWDDSRAADKCRIDEARALIRQYTLTVRVHSIDLPTAAFVRNPDSGPTDQGYISVRPIPKQTARGVMDASLYRVLAHLSKAVVQAKEFEDCLPPGLCGKLQRAAKTIQGLRVPLAGE